MELLQGQLDQTVKTLKELEEKEVRNPNEAEVVEVPEQEVDFYYPRIGYCPACGSASIQREERGMERVYHFKRYYCQDSSDR